MGPYMDLIGMHHSCADMEPREAEFMQALSAEMGADGAQEWFNNFGQSIRGSETPIPRLRPDLGSNAN